jgi:hypothetical protein
MVTVLGLKDVPERFTVTSPAPDEPELDELEELDDELEELEELDEELPSEHATRVTNAAATAAKARFFLGFMRLLSRSGLGRACAARP